MKNNWMAWALSAFGAIFLLGVSFALPHVSSRISSLEEKMSTTCEEIKREGAMRSERIVRLEAMFESILRSLTEIKVEIKELKR